MKNINHILTIFLTLAALIGCDNHQSPPPKTENNVVNPTALPEIKNFIPAFDLTRKCQDDQYTLLSADGMFTIVYVDASRLFKNLEDEYANLARANMHEGFTIVTKIVAGEISTISYSSRMTRQFDNLFYEDKLLSPVTPSELVYKLINAKDVGSDTSTYMRTLFKKSTSKTPILAEFCVNIEKWGLFLPLVSHQMENIIRASVQTSLYSKSPNNKNLHVGLKINADSTFTFLYERYNENLKRSYELSQYIHGKVEKNLNTLVLIGLGEIRHENNSYVLSVNKPIMVNTPNSSSPYPITLEEEFELRIETMGNSNMHDSTLINKLIAPLFDSTTDTEIQP